MKTSINGLNLIKLDEGCILHPYQKNGDVPTIGIGTTWYPGGRRVTMKDKPITMEQALSYLQNVLTVFEPDVNHCIQSKINQNQFDAIMDFTYQEGIGNFTGSNLLRVINKNPNDPQIKHEFLKWVYADGKINDGIVERRNRDIALYFKPM